MTRGSLAGHLSCASLTRPLAEERQKTIIIVDRVCALTTRTMEATVAQPTVMRLMCNIVARNGYRNNVSTNVEEIVPLNVCLPVNIRLGFGRSGSSNFNSP